MQPLFTPRQIHTVSDLLTRIKKLNERNFSLIWLQGEITSFTRAGSGHLYFTLSDGQASLRAVMFRGQAALLRFLPREGQKILCRGDISLYAPRGELQFIAESLEPVGQGEEALALARLKERLAAQGLLAPERKRPLPSLPERIVLITSIQGAARHDFFKVLRGRKHGMEIKIIPSQMQGQSALPGLLAILERLRNCSWPQVLVVSRGGGSNQDLALFNREELALAVAASPIPVLMAVGHEIDVSVCDLVADIRAATPTAAAQMLLAPWLNLYDKLSGLNLRLRKIMLLRLNMAGLRLESLKRRLRHPGQKLAWQKERLARVLNSLKSAVRSRVGNKITGLDRLEVRLRRINLPQRAMHAHTRLEGLLTRGRKAQKNRLERGQEQWQTTLVHLNALNPLSILVRGYALVQDEKGVIIRERGQVNSGQALNIRLARGKIKARVE
jgi:exodeoxyribonuclease VII large subunit